jgi:hypothetical protein
MTKLYDSEWEAALFPVQIRHMWKMEIKKIRLKSNNRKYHQPQQTERCGGLWLIVFNATFRNTVFQLDRDSQFY